MTRSLSTIVAAGVLLLLAAPAQATAPVAVDFSVLMVNGVDTAIDITSPASLTLNGVTFSYDNFGTPINELGDPVFAQAQSFGIFGNPNNGVLTMSFDVPVSELSFTSTTAICPTSAHRATTPWSLCWVSPMASSTASWWCLAT